MSLQYVIDGYNIINHPHFRQRHKEILNPAESLSAFIQEKRLGGSTKNKIIIVFDGYPSGSEAVQTRPGHSLVYSRKLSADEKIKRIVEESADRKNIVVISDDKEVKLTARFLGARVMGVEEFVRAKVQRRSLREDDSKNAELSYSAMHKINQELRKIWLE